MLPLPGSLRGGAAIKVVAALLSRRLIREHIVDSLRKADAVMNTFWRNLPEPDGRGELLFITAAGADVIGIEPGAVPYAFDESINLVGEPAAGAPKGAEPPKAPGPAAECDARGLGLCRGTARLFRDSAAAANPRGEWLALKPGANEGYVSWERAEAIRAMFSDNIPANRHHGAPKHGDALLVGLVRCRHRGLS